MTTAFLKPSGTSPSLSENLTNLVRDGRRMSMHSLIRNVGNGSNRNDLVDDYFSDFILSDLSKDC